VFLGANSGFGTVREENGESGEVATRKAEEEKEAQIQFVPVAESRSEGI